MDDACTRVLPTEPRRTLGAYVAHGGGRGLEAARAAGPDAVLAEIEAAGLRGRGGAGFPTATKWQTVARYASSVPRSAVSVVVNGAEGEPGTFKDRSILRRNPFAVIEGALIAAFVVGAERVVIALKDSFARADASVREALAEVHAAGWTDGLVTDIDVVLGPGEYLFGEETALLDVLDGGPPFPRVAPPYRHEGAPTLVNNVETIANVPGIVADGADVFRSLGTAESPGTVVVTITGATVRHGVAEVPMGMPLGDAIERIGGGPVAGRELVAAMSGTANPLLPAALFHTPLAYETMRDAGSGLGAAGFLVFDNMTDLAAVVAGVSRFLAVESCGQCTPCKQDGLALATLLERIVANTASGTDAVSPWLEGAGAVMEDVVSARLTADPGVEPDVVSVLSSLASSVTDEARCSLAGQQQRVVGSLLSLFPDAIRRHVAGRALAVEPYPIVPLTDLVNGRAVLDVRELHKQPDWTFGEADSGKAPAERLAVR